MKTLITGAGGFIGSILCERCVELGYKVKAFVKYNSKASYGWLDSSRYRQEIEFVSGDVRDYDSVFDAMQECDAVFHLAALIGIPYSYVSPLAYVKTNIEGTYNILQAARSRNIENLLVTSTSETYGTAQYVPIDEGHPLVGQSPYSASKIAADQLALSYNKSFGLPVKIVRPFNTYGPRQSARAVIPTIITQILAGKRRIDLGNLSPTRDLTYVEDTAEGFIEIGKSKRLSGEVTNIGMNHEISVAELANLIAELMNVNIDLTQAKERVRPKDSEVERLRCNNSKIIAETGWKPKFDIRSGLTATIEWLKQNMSIYNPEVYTK